MIGAGRHADEIIDGPHASRLISPIHFGQIRPANGESPQLLEFTRTWCGSTMRLAYAYKKAANEFFEIPDEPAMTICASRMSPAILVRLNGSLTLFQDMAQAGVEKACALPSYLAVGAPGGEVAIAAGDKADTLPLAAMDRGWLLAWYGAKSFLKAVTCASAGGLIRRSRLAHDNWTKFLYDADCPLLILFSEAPAELSSEPFEGLKVVFDSNEAAALIVPLFGELMPRAEETEKWSGGLPQEAIERCDWWAGHADLYPSGVNERYAYDKTSDTAIITQDFEFERFRPGDGVAAPVPPYIATAFLEGFPLEFSSPPASPDFTTAAGSWLAVPGERGYEIRVKGLAKYVPPRPAPEGGAAPPRLTDELAGQVRQILDAGHLAPWFRPKKIANGWVWGYIGLEMPHLQTNPGEVLHALAEALPFLPADTRQAALEYMERERREYPPEQIPFLSHAEGARCEFWPLSGEYMRDPPTVLKEYRPDYQKDNFFLANKLIPLISMRYLASYYLAKGGQGMPEAWPDIRDVRLPYLQQADWGTGGEHRWPGAVYSQLHRGAGETTRRIRWEQGGNLDANSNFSVAAAYIAMARMASDAEAEAQAWGLLARSAIRCYALGRMIPHLYLRGLITPAPGVEGTDEDPREIIFMDEYGMTFSHRRYYALKLMENAFPETGFFLRDRLIAETGNKISAFTAAFPGWFLAWNERGTRHETNSMDPADGLQVFLARAWLFNDPPDRMEKYLDVPWLERGDLCHIHKLVETIRLYMARP